MNAPAPNPLLCPLCGAPNECATEIARATGRAPGPCWCMQADFPNALLEKIPAQARGKACICQKCAQQGHMGRST